MFHAKCWETSAYHTRRRSGRRIDSGGREGPAPAEPRDGAPKTDSSADAKAKAADALVSRMMAFDKNKDGKLTRDEVTDPRLERMFDRADADHDGVVTKEELTAWATKTAAEDSGNRDARDGMGPPDGGPDGPPRRRGQRGRGFGGRGGFGGFGQRTPPGQIMSASVIETLKLSVDQKKSETELQKHVDDELGKMLNAKQKQRLKDLAGGPGGPGRRGRGGPGGFGGPPNGGPPGGGPQDGGPRGPAGADGGRDRGPGGPPDGNGPPDGGPPGGRPGRDFADRGFGGPPPGYGGGGGGGGRGRFGGGSTPGQILSPNVADELNLKSNQKKQLATLQKEVDDKLAVLLNDEQKKQLKEISQRSRRGGPNGGRRGGPNGGPPDGRPGGGGPGERENTDAASPPRGEQVASITHTDSQPSSPSLVENWPQWRGPNYDGISHETNLPTTWSESSNILWKLEMPGMGGSTPAVWDKHIFLTSQEGDNLVICARTQTASCCGSASWAQTGRSWGTRERCISVPQH